MGMGAAGEFHSTHKVDESTVFIAGMVEFRIRAAPLGLEVGADE